MINRYRCELKHFLRRLSELLFWLPEYFSPKGHIFVYISSPYYAKSNCNWGDDLNRYLIEKISGKKVVHARCILFPQTFYLCIGSIIQWFADENAIVWGAGLIEPAIVKPCKEYRAVRGPLTRTVLLNQGIDCPEVYGDPALLMPLYYHPSISKVYKIGLICHYSEIGSKCIRNILKSKNLHFIDIRRYGTCTDFVDEVLSCEYIISSSLHGCIISDAYGIPNLWSRFSDYQAEGCNFKFRDYFLSVKKQVNSPFIITEDSAMNTIIEEIKEKWTKPIIDLDKLMDACPFSKENENKYNDRIVFKN